MNWNAIKEYGDSRIQIEFTGTIIVERDTVALNSQSGREWALGEVQRQADLFGVEIGNRLHNARAQFLERKERMPLASQILPWLPEQRVPIQPVELKSYIGAISDYFDDRLALPGQSFPPNKNTYAINLAEVSVLSSRSFSAVPISIYIVEARLVEGSVKAVFKVILECTKGTVLLLASALAQTGVDAAVDYYIFATETQSIIKGQSCTSKAEWVADLSLLNRHTMREFNYKEPGIPQELKQLRICNVQLALAKNYRAPRLIDGVIGQQTQTTLNYFYEEEGFLDGMDLNDEIVQARLLSYIKK